MRADLATCRILIVDDEMLVLEVLEAMLSSAGCDVQISDDPQNALELIWREDFDVVITDLGMPKLNGWAVAKHVKAKNAMTPVIVVTGWGAQHEERDVTSSGVDMLFSKPLDLHVLIGAVQEVMAKSIRRPGKNRRHKRVPARKAAIVSLAPLSPGALPYQAELLDVSRGGLCFLHSEGESLTGTLLKVEIRMPGWGMLDLSPAVVVYDTQYEAQSSSEPTTSRRCGIQFENLSKEQGFQLEAFIRSLASDDGRNKRTI